MEREDFIGLIRGSQPADWKLVGEGRQSKVYSRDGLDFVLKLPKSGYENQLATGHAIGRQKLGGIATRFDSIVLDPSIIDGKSDNKPTTAYIHEKTPSLEDLIPEWLRKNQNVGRELVRRLAAVDRETLKRGVYARLLGVKNYGVDKDGQVKHLDLGDFRADLSSQKISTEARELAFYYRGMSHYQRIFWIRGLDPFGLENYAKAYGLEFPLPPKKHMSLTPYDFHCLKDDIAKELMDKGLIRESDHKKLFEEFSKDQFHQDTRIRDAMFVFIQKQKGVFQTCVDLTKQEMDKYFIPDGTGVPLGHYFGQNRELK